jgi:PAS domain S-box-containing protein
MPEEKETSSAPADLRRRAEEVVQQRQHELREIPPEDLQDLIHELRVHQVELEMQNEELRRTQQELERARDAYADLYDLAPVGYLTLDERGTTLQANLTAGRMLDVDRSRLIDRPLTDFIAREDQDTFYLHRRRVLETREPQTAEFRMITQDGSKLWVRMEATPTGPQGDQPTFRATISDVTEQKALEEQLRQQERLAAVGRLAGGIAHDFNNILASIILYAQMSLDRSAPAPDTRDALRTILEESRRGADLVQQILDFSRNAMIDTEPLSLVALVQETSALLRQTLPEHVRLVTEVTSHACTVQADPTRIHQVVMNLALNARDAMPDGGTLCIAVDSVTLSQDSEPPVLDMTAGAWARLTVSDTGTGMTEEAQEHLFEPFFTTKEVGKGTGLGLAQVHGIVKQHQGFIDVDTAAGEGTTVTIFLPLVEDTDEKPPETTQSSPPCSQPATILVVEDARNLRTAIRAGLEFFGHRVITAAEGHAALDAMSSHDVDLVITDLAMPGMGGKALLDALRERNLDLKVIAMTGHISDRDVQRLKDYGFSDAVPKPFSMEKLIATIGAVLNT